MGRTINRALVLVLAAAGCGDPATQAMHADATFVFPDGGSPDLVTSQRCADVKDAVSFAHNGHRSCVRDSDCILVPTACGLDPLCGVFANSGAAGPDLSALIQIWNTSCVDAQCACPTFDHTAACIAGTCGAKPPAARLVGDACQSGSDCATNECVLPSLFSPFTDGYCSIYDCQRRGIACPTGSTCMPLGSGTHTMCLRKCDTTSPSVQCRSTYSCCGGGGPLGLDQAWCVPSSSSYCSG